MKNKKIPLRTCVVTKEKLEKEKRQRTSKKGKAEKK